MGEHFAEEQIRDLLDELKVLRTELAGMQLTWTFEVPTVPGWYWSRHPHILELVMVWVGQDAIDRNEFKPGTQWAGPIPEPAEPAVNS